MPKIRNVGFTAPDMSPSNITSSQPLKINLSGRSCFVRLIKSIAEAEGNYANIRRLTRLLELLLELFEDYRAPPNPPSHTTSEQVLEFIKQNYRGRLTLDMISGAVNVSKFHLCRVFKQDTHMTITEYIIQYRLAEVKKRLIDTNESIADIAADTGFETYTYFCTLFHRLEGMSPSEYRQARRK